MEWTRGRTVGRGSTATVSIATVHHSGEVLAVKSTELLQSEFLKREQRILSTIKCSQIIAYKECNVTNENGKLLYNLCMEYASGGTIVDEIQRQGGSLDERTIKSHARAILQGLNHLHSIGIVHCDIKGTNVLITEDGVKIGDMGCARRVDSAAFTIAGTPLFMAPEVARGEEQGYPSDIWALGCTLIEMATGKAPWPDVLDPVSALYRIGFSGDLPQIPGFMSKQGNDFLGKCLKRDPSERWSASELLQHAFLEESDYPSKEDDESNWDTPTCVLDQGIWDSMEEWEETHNSTGPSYLDSPMERIQRLCGGLPTWEWDQNWVTVRDSSIDKPEKPSCNQRQSSINGPERPFINEPERPSCCQRQSGINEPERPSCSQRQSGINEPERPFCSQRQSGINESERPSCSHRVSSINEPERHSCSQDYYMLNDNEPTTSRTDAPFVILNGSTRISGMDIYDMTSSSKKVSYRNRRRKTGLFIGSTCMLDGLFGNFNFEDNGNLFCFSLVQFSVLEILKRMRIY